MNNKTITIVIAAVVGGAVGALVCFTCFYYFTTFRTEAGPRPVGTPVFGAPTATPEVAQEKNVPASDIESVEIKTVYRGYFAPSDSCSKTYNEYFGVNGSYSSSDSPCSLDIVLSRIGPAEKSLKVSQWDAAAKQLRPVREDRTAGTLSPAAFDQLASAIVSNDAFRSWREGTMINISNCSITVKYAGGSKSVMSNVGPSTTDYLKMIDAVKKADAQVDWKKAA